MTNQSAGSKVYQLSTTTPVWFPASSVIAGTLTSQNTRITGVGTSFRSQINIGDYLVDGTNIARKVMDIRSDTDLIVDAVFIAPLANSTCVRVRNQTLRRLEVIFTTSNGKIRDADQDTDATWPVAVLWKSSDGLDTYLAPILVTPGAGGASVTEVI